MHSARGALRRVALAELAEVVMHVLEEQVYVLDLELHRVHVDAGRRAPHPHAALRGLSAELMSVCLSLSFGWVQESDQEALGTVLLISRGCHSLADTKSPEKKHNTDSLTGGLPRPAQTLPGATMIVIIIINIHIIIISITTISIVISSNIIHAYDDYHYY